MAKKVASKRQNFPRDLYSISNTQGWGTIVEGKMSNANELLNYKQNMKITFLCVESVNGKKQVGVETEFGIVYL